MLINRNAYLFKATAVLVLNLFILIFTSCSVKKVGKGTYLPVDKEEDFILANNRNYNSIERVWFKKFSGEYESSGKKQKFKGNIRIVKDSLMIIGLASNMGVEGFRIFLKPDSVFVLNRLKATYYAGPVSVLKDGRLRILNFSVLQDILLANSSGLFKTDVKPDIEKDHQLKLLCYKNKDSDYQAFTSHNKLIARKVCYRGSDGLLNSGDFIFSEWNENIHITYPEYTQMENVKIPMKVILESIYRQKKEILKITFGKTEINMHFPVRLKVGSKYKRVNSFNEL